jgi:hypothetical protein
MSYFRQNATIAVRALVSRAAIRRIYRPASALRWSGVKVSRLSSLHRNTDLKRNGAEASDRERGGDAVAAGLRAEPERLSDLVAAAFDLGRRRVVLGVFAIEEVLGLFAEHEHDAGLDCCAIGELDGEPEAVAG